jgi:hypothetical protein
MKRCVGLHIRKCAGTSLMTFVRTRLVEQQVYVFSSFYQNMESSRPEIFDIKNIDRLQFIFGHSLTEEMYKLFDGPQTILFTGFRDPIKTLKSDFCHHVNIARRYGTEDPNVEEYIHNNRNFMTSHLLGNFPIAAELSRGKSRSEKAKAVLTLFDHIYDSENFKDSVQILLTYLNIGDMFDYRSNVGNIELYKEKKICQALELLDNRGKDLMSEDLVLYQYYRANSQTDRRGFINIQNTAVDRKQLKNEWMSALPSLEECGEKVKKNIIKSIAQEARIIGKVQESIELYKSRIRHSNEVVAELERENN